MDRLFNKILFFVFGIIYAPLTLFSHLTYPWWMALSKGGINKKIIYFILAPIYAPITLFLHLTYDWWAELAK